MQSSGRRSSGVAYRYARRDEEDEEQRPPADETAESEDEEAADAAATQLEAAAVSSSPQSWFDRVNTSLADASSSAVQAISKQPAVAGAILAGLSLAGLLLVRLFTASSRRPASRKTAAAAGSGRRKPQAQQQQGLSKPAAAAAAASTAGPKAGGGKSPGKAGKAKKTAAAAAAPGPNAKVKPSATCAPLPDGSAVVVKRPIAADNSCLFNAVGYAMHHSTNRAPFLRQVVSREVSSDPQEYSAAFLGMPNASYCAWILDPTQWGGGIELAILATHYRREIAAWNLATGACHVFGEERGFTKQVMVIYNGVHYDALAISASPRADPDDDVTEFNPRTKRGKMILAAAQQLVKMNRKGAPSHHEQQQQQQQDKKAPDGGAAREAESKVAAAAAAAAANGAGTAPASDANGAGMDDQPLLVCGSCGEQLLGVDAARAHAAATGHAEFMEVEASK